MPNHETHDAIGLLAAPAVGVGAGLLLSGLGSSPADSYSGALLVSAAHLWATWMLSPDLDLASVIHERWGLLGFIWQPYMRLIPHRNWMSHSGISGVFRLLYLAAAIWLLLWLCWAGGAMLLRVPGVPEYHAIATAWLLGSIRGGGAAPAALIVAGAIVADVLHVAADLISTEIKVSWRRLWRGR